MPTFIVKLTDKDGIDYYLLWCSITDAPRCAGLSLDDFVKQYNLTHDPATLAERMQRVQAKGTSALEYDSVLDLIIPNRAGPHECCLSYDELIRFYCHGEVADPNSSCWSLRRDKTARILEEKRDMSSGDLEGIFNQFPYAVC